MRVKRIIKIAFRGIIIRIPNHPSEIPCYIIDSLLHSINKDLSICEMKALYINFMIRFNEDQKKRKESGDNVYKVGSEEFKQALKTDPFFNALKVKFGYAITCHKAQGGEWDKVFVDYYGRVSLKTDPLRWCYTATTRGINTVFAVNVPQFGKIDKLKFAPMGTIGTIPNEALSLAWVPTSPFHKRNDHKCKSLKYWEILEKLENTSYRVKNVESLGGFQERYILEKDGLEIKLNGHHKVSGHFIEPFRIMNNVDDNVKKELEAIVNSDFNPVFKINYIPEFDTLADLHSMMQENCNELSIVITNIAKGKQYYISYFLKTDSVCSFIQFYHDKEGRLTTAMPKTYNCTRDSKLLSLIQNLEPHAS